MGPRNAALIDYPYSTKEHFDNWVTSRRCKSSQKYLGMCNSISENSSTDDSDRGQFAETFKES